MPVTRLDLVVPSTTRARDLFVDLLGGEPGPGGATDGGSATMPGGATLAWTAAPGARSVLAGLTLAVPDPDRAVAALPARGARLRPRLDGWTFRAPVLGVDVHVIQATADDAGPETDRRPGHGGAGTRSFDHACFAVSSLADAVDLLRTRLGGAVVFGGHNRELETLSSQVAFGPGTMVELLQPTRPDAALQRFLDRRGPGLHHLTWHVHDVPTAEAAAVAAGFDVVDTDLQRRAHWRETYLRPAAALGLLVQLAWTDRSHVVPLDDDVVTAILAGQVDSWGYTMRRAGA